LSLYNKKQANIPIGTKRYQNLLRFQKEYDMEKILKVSDVVNLLKMSKTTIYKYDENGKIPSLKISSNLRFKEDQITQFISTCCKKQKEPLKA
jgi:excisionase family DNA binding protein